MTARRNGSLEKSARLLILLNWKLAGMLEGLTYQAIADRFPNPPHRATIERDLKDLERLEKVIDEMRKQ